MEKTACVLLLAVTMGACARPPKAVPPPAYKVVTHPRIALGWVPPLGTSVEIYRGGVPGWKFSTDGSPGGLLLLPSNRDFFFGATRPTIKTLIFQANRDFSTLQLGLQALSPLIKKDLTIIAVASQATRTRDGADAYLRIVDLQLPTLLPAAPESLRNVLLMILSGLSPTAQDLTGKGTVDRYRMLYYLGPVLSKNGEWIQVQNQPAMIRVLLLVKANDAKKVKWLTEKMAPHFQSGFFGLGKLKVVRSSISWKMPNRKRTFGLIVDIDSSSSVVAGEFNQFLDAVLATLDYLDESGIDVRVTMLRGCDGKFVTPVASATSFAIGYDAAKTYLEERKKLLLTDQECTLNGFQGLLGLERQLHTPPPELEDTDQNLFLLFSDGDDHSHPLNGQNQISEQVVSHYADEITLDSRWKILIVAPGNRCVFDEFSAIEPASRLIALSDGISRFFIDDCDRDWPERFANRIQFVAALENPFTFAMPPLVPSLSVTLDKTKLTQNSERGWEFDWETSSLIFGPLVAIPPESIVGASGYFVINDVK